MIINHKKWAKIARISIETHIFVQKFKKPNMENRDLNRLKVVLAEKKKTNRWLAEQLGKDQTTISKWCTNSSQPDLASLMQIAQLLEVELADLVRFEEFKQNGTK